MKDNGHTVVQSYHDLVRSDVLALVPENLTSVLDIGGGVGASAAALKRAGKVSKAVVVDLVASNALPEIDASYEGNLEDPDLIAKIAKEQGTFDVVLCLDVLEHLSDPWSVIKAAHQMLSPNGVIVASIPNVRNYRLLGPLLFQGKFELTDSGILDRTHLRWFVKDTAIELMCSSGLTLEVVAENINGRKRRLFNKLTFGVLSDILALQYYIRVRRAG